MRSKKTTPIFRKILFYMGTLILIQAVVLFGVIITGGVFSHLNQNAQDILHERVLNRKSYIENEMINTWSNIDSNVSDINKKVQGMLENGQISNVSELDDSSENCSDLILEISDDLISLMRSNRVSGAYIVFNCDDLDEMISSKNYVSKPGLYLHDLDPISTPSEKNFDILIIRAPVSVVQKLDISTDSSWNPLFKFEKDGDIPLYIYEPFQKAYLNTQDSVSFSDFGYWGEINKFGAITYSVPLILDDGTVYGVLGVEISVNYLQKILPYSELADNKVGSYILGIEKNDDLVFDTVIISGSVYSQSAPSHKKTILTPIEGNNTQYSDYYINTDSDTFYCCCEYITLYNTNTPFVSQRWALIGTVRTQNLFAFSDKIMETIIISIIATLFIGILGSYVASKAISNPIAEISKGLDSANPSKVVKLQRTGISEVDILAKSIETLSSDVFDSAFKFTQIMDMAVVKIACFEINYTDNTFFLTDKFFQIFQQPEVDTAAMTSEQFIETIKLYDEYKITSSEGLGKENDSVYRIPNASKISSNPEEEYVYVRLKYMDDEKRCIGLAEDITQTMLEKMKLQHERDYDLLTGLLNRRAFHKTMTELFTEKVDSLKCAALAMMDLDNLKYVNDTYGHDYGDKYIRTAAECFIDGTPSSTVISRISGDEFYLFFYGYSSEEEIRAIISDLRERISKKTLTLPNQETRFLKISGGISWYGTDSTNYHELMRYSDYALNSVKKSVKGVVADFDVNVYNREAYLIQNRAELTELIEKSLVTYHFQPIIEAATGEIFAYEAFMRASMPTLKNPTEILTLAKIEGKLSQIETLTWFKVIATYARYVETGIIPKGSKIFINSISGQAPSESNIIFLEERYSKYLKNMVLEVTDDERTNSDTLKFKREKVLEWCAELAIDNYNGESNLSPILQSITPNYIKVNISMTKLNSPSPRKLDSLKSIISFAHEKNIKIIAEGIETQEEATILKSIGADYLQGYFIAKPSEIPIKKVL